MFLRKWEPECEQIEYVQKVSDLALVTIHSSLLFRERVVKGNVDVEAAHCDR